MRHARLLLTTTLAIAIAGLPLVGCATAEKKPDPVVVEKPKPQPKVDSTAALVADGTKLLKEGRATDAKTKFESALAKDPASMDAKVGLAQANLKLGEFDAAKAILTDLQKEKPDAREVVLLLGLLHKEQGNYGAGIKLYEGELEKQEKAGTSPDSEMLNNLISMYRLAKDYDEAIKACTKLLSRDPGNNDALKNLSLVYFDQEKYDLAETIAINSLKKNDKDADLYNNRGMIRVKKKRYPEAMSYFYKAVEIDPNNMAAHLNIGSIALRYRDYDNAAKHFGAAMKLEPKHPEANLGYGLALSGQSGGLPPDAQQAKAPEAISQLQRALEIDPKASLAMGEIAMIYKLQLTNLAEAKNWCEQYKTAAKPGDGDVMKAECQNVDNEIKASEAAARAMEQMKKQQEEAAKAEGAKAPAPTPPADGGGEGGGEGGGDPQEAASDAADGAGEG